MGFFDTEKGVDEYIKMAEGYDGAELIKILQKYLPEKSTVLELGMGPVRISQRAHVIHYKIMRFISDSYLLL